MLATKAVTSLLKFGSYLVMIKDLAIEDSDHRVVFIMNGLLAVFEVDYGQSARVEGYPVIKERA